MVSKLISFLQQRGTDFLEVVNATTSVWKVYKVAGSAVDRLRGFIGQRQKENLHKTGEAAGHGERRRLGATRYRAGYSMCRRLADVMRSAFR
jgi:hypothetical protein